VNVEGSTVWSLSRVIKDIAACPKCHGPLAEADVETLVCAACSVRFPVRDGIPCMEIDHRSAALSREVEWYEGEPSDAPEEHGRSSTTPPPRFSEGHYLAHDKARRDISRALRENGVTESSLVLSVATGDGIEIPLIEAVSTSIVGIDIALIALRRFREKFPYPVFQGNVRSLPFRTGVFDACVVSGLLHHLVGHDELTPYLVEFCRVLRPGGLLVVVEPNSLYPVQLILGPINRVVQRYRPGWRGLVAHEQPISPRFMAGRLKRAGFQDVAYVGTTFLHNRMPAGVARMVDSMENGIRMRRPFRLFAWFVLMTARKGT
jgi:SAM-dependent methyltransferase